MLTMAAFQVREIFGGRRVWILVVFLIFPLLLSLAMAGGQDGPRNLPHPILVSLFFWFYHFSMYVLFIPVLLGLLYGATLMGSELERKTLTYLFTRPTPKWKIVVGKYLGVVLSLSIVTWPGLLLGWLAWGGVGGGRMLAALTVTLILSTLAFNAAFAVLDVLLPRRAMVAGFIVAVIVEGVLTLIPTVISMFTLGYYLRSVSFAIAGMDLADAKAAVRLAGRDRMLQDFRENLIGGENTAMTPRDLEKWDDLLEYLSRVLGDVSLPAAILTLLLVALCAISLAAWIAGRREYIMNEQA